MCGLSELYSQRQRLARIWVPGAVVQNSVMRNPSLNRPLNDTEIVLSRRPWLDVCRAAGAAGLTPQP